ncbi:hypothetical protein PGAL8A_00101100 [Plasmodium gallinaceum]|uniref:Uncharacterized protein n=1 Tax=Plasmodium gallinaceum TaxID=5849 RepID=A0A1J1GLQ3_PLAGA|nr:hypothetical protein PGAL8A_00101100 [Plasmodium gallinaceum]CRG93305.1 hypothetical protein PGAL8A_00101100 [Plasmodium gallinaceum]
MIDLNYNGSCNLINDDSDKDHIKNKKKNNKNAEVNVSFKPNEFEYFDLNEIYKKNILVEKNKKEDIVDEKVGILAENVDEIFFDTKIDSHILNKKNLNLKDYNGNDINQLKKEAIENQIIINNNNGKIRKYSLIDYKILCRKNKMSVIDVIENPLIEKELVDVVNKANLKVHWGTEKIKEFEKDSSNKNEINLEKEKMYKNNRHIINNSEIENEFDAAIDLLKSYYQLKETFIYYISQNGKLLPANMSIFKKVISIKLSNNKTIKINIENIIKVEDHLINSKYIKINNMQNLNLIVINYKKSSKVYYFPIIFKDKLKLCLFFSLIKSYHRINFKEFSEEAMELMSRYSLGVNVKKVSKNGRISDCKILIYDNVIRFFSTTKMKGKIFDILQDFLSYETCIDVSYFNLLSETQKKQINQEECVVLHFINSSVPLIFSSPSERDNFIMLFLFLRRH